MRWIAWFVMFAAYFVAYSMLTEMHWAEGTPLIWGLCTVALFCVILVHELGHAIVARYVGAEVRSIMVWPFQYDVTRRSFGMAVPRQGGDVGGYVAFRLNRSYADRKHMLVAAAGQGQICLLPPPPAAMSGSFRPIALGEARDALSACTDAFAALSIGAGLANLLPFAGSDGTVLWRGLRASIS